MAIYKNLPVYEESYQLLLQTVQLCTKMQRDYRYSLGEDIKRLLMSMLVTIYKATLERDKIPLLKVANEKMVEVKITLRVLNELRQIPDKQFMLLTEHTTSISRQLSSWEKYENIHRV